MTNRLSSYEGEYPIWLWTERPDLRKSGYLENGKEGVLLEINLEETEVLISDFMSWHCVLNNMMLPTSEKEDNENRLDIIQSSWERIFDINLLKTDSYIIEHVTDADKLQGTTGKVNLENIKLIKEFIAR